MPVAKVPAGQATLAAVPPAAMFPIRSVVDPTGSAVACDIALATSKPATSVATTPTLVDARTKDLRSGASDDLL
jgi:hypothetical protein